MVFRGSILLPIEGIIVFATFIAFFGSALLFLASRLGEKIPYSSVKMESYECGLPAEEKKDTKISVKFYLTAILFILFDIEIIFMYPWGVTFKEFVVEGHGAYIFYSMLFFLALFVFGLFWEIKSKALEWD